MVPELRNLISLAQKFVSYLNFLSGSLYLATFEKGRTNFDFAWYISRGVYPNLPHLEAALRQFGPWQDDTVLSADRAWLQEALEHKIGSIDWDAAKANVRRFLRPAEDASLALWSERFFLSKLSKMENLYLPNYLKV